MLSGDPFSFCINNTVLFLRFALLTAPDPFLTYIHTNSFHGFLSQSRLSSGCGLSSIPPPGHACPCVSHWCLGTPRWGSGLLWALRFEQGSYQYNSSPVADPAASLHTSECKAALRLSGFTEFKADWRSASCQRL